MTFSYRPYEIDATPAQPGVTVVYRPVIRFGVTGGNRSAEYLGLLDTGADETLLPRRIAERLGIVIDDSQSSTVLSASGEMPVVYGSAFLEVALGERRYRWRATVGFVDQPWQEALLGHAGFLRYFDTSFLGGKRMVRMNRNRVPLPQV